MLGGKTPTRLTKGVAMSIPSVNFISYNSTGINSVKTKWIRELCNFVTDSSYICIQEHFKNSKSQICAPRKNTGPFYPLGVCINMSLFCLSCTIMYFVYIKFCL